MHGNHDSEVLIGCVEPSWFFLRPATRHGRSGEMQGRCGSQRPKGSVMGIANVVGMHLGGFNGGEDVSGGNMRARGVGGGGRRVG